MYVQMFSPNTKDLSNNNYIILYTTIHIIVKYLLTVLYLNMCLEKSLFPFCMYLQKLITSTNGCNNILSLELALIHTYYIQHL